MRKIPLEEIARRSAAIAGVVQYLEVMGRDERASRLDHTRRRLERVRDARRLVRFDQRRRAVAEALDRFDEQSEDELRAAGALVAYVDGHRIVAVNGAQGFRQYGRIRAAMLDLGIPNEPAEFVARELALRLLGSEGMQS